MYIIHRGFAQNRFNEEITIYRFYFILFFITVSGHKHDAQRTTGSSQSGRDRRVKKKRFSSITPRRRFIHYAE